MERLVTLEQYNQLPPVARAYVVYMQGDLPGSELKGLSNPYPAGSTEHEQWSYGERLAVQQAQDSEE